MKTFKYQFVADKIIELQAFTREEVVKIAKKFYVWKDQSCEVADATIKHLLKTGHISIFNKVKGKNNYIVHSQGMDSGKAILKRAKELNLMPKETTYKQDIENKLLKIHGEGFDRKTAVEFCNSNTFFAHPEDVDAAIKRLLNKCLIEKEFTFEGKNYYFFTPNKWVLDENEKVHKELHNIISANTCNSKTNKFRLFDSVNVSNPKSDKFGEIGTIVKINNKFYEVDMNISAGGLLKFTDDDLSVPVYNICEDKEINSEIMGNVASYKYSSTEEKVFTLPIPSGYKLKEQNPRIPKVGELCLWWYSAMNEGNDFEPLEYSKTCHKDKHPILGLKRFILEKDEPKVSFRCGEEVEVSHNKNHWSKRIFVKNYDKEYATFKYAESIDQICASECLETWKYIRKIK